jgi:hypothetical protein
METKDQIRINVADSEVKTNEVKNPAYSTAQPTTAASQAKSDRRSMFDTRRSMLTVFGVGANGSCCGTSGVAAIARFILLMPSWITTLGLIVVSSNLRESVNADSIRIPMQAISCGCLVVSRFIITASKNEYPRWYHSVVPELSDGELQGWMERDPKRCMNCWHTKLNYLEVFEFLIIMVCALANCLLSTPITEVHGWPLQSLGLTFAGVALCGMCVHGFVIQVRDFQEEKYTM